MEKKIKFELTRKEAQAIIQVIGEVADHDDVLLNNMNFDKTMFNAAKRAQDKIEDAYYSTKHNPKTIK